MAAAASAGAKLLALNASRELTKKVSRQGLEALTPDERAQVPELKLDDVRHRAWFDGLMSELGGAHAGRHMRNVVDASKLLCAGLARDA